MSSSTSTLKSTTVFSQGGPHDTKRDDDDFFPFHDAKEVKRPEYDSLQTGITTSSLPPTKPPSYLDDEQLSRITKAFSLAATATMEECFQAAYTTCKTKNWTVIETIKTDLDAVVNEKGQTILLSSLDKGDTDLAQDLIKRQITLHVKDRNGNNPFHYAAKMGDTLLVKQLWEHLYINETNGLGQTPLHLAAEWGKEAVLSDLLANGAQANAPATYAIGNTTFEKVTPLQIAVIKGQRRSIDILINQGADLSLKLPHIGNLLHLAIHFHQRYTFKHLITTYFSRVKHLINDKNDEHQTPLMLAAFLGEGEAIAFLKTQGAALETKDSQGRTALHWAAIGGQRQAIDLLYYYGCNLNAADNKRNRPEDLLKDNKDLISQSLFSHLMNLGLQQDRLVTQPPLFTVTLPENLVFKGGGPKGIAYVGAVGVLEEQNNLKELRRIAGTSAGAINASLMAVGYRSAEMQQILSTTDFKSFLDHPLTTRGIISRFKVKDYLKILRVLLLPGFVTAFITKFKDITGLHMIGGSTGEPLRIWIEDLIVKKTGISHCTFGELNHLIHQDPTGPFKHLYVFTCDISTGKTGKITQIDSEDPQWKEVIISDAIRASTSIPGAFEPHILHIKDGTGNRVPAKHLGMHVDGGLIRNYPIDAFDKRKHLSTSSDPETAEWHVINRRTLGFTLYSSNIKPPEPDRQVETIGDLLSSVVDIYNNAEELLTAQVYDNRFRTIRIDNQGVGLLEFGLSPERQKLLVDSGKTATQTFYQEQNLTTDQTSLFIHSRIVLEAQGNIKLKQIHPDFTGRENYLKDLEKRLLGTDNHFAQAVLTGPPGYGKTETAIAFGNRHLEQFSLVWSIESDTPEKMAQSYRELARQLELFFQEQDSLDTIRSRVHHHLETTPRKKPFLLIFDNAEKALILPQRGNGRILITSRENGPWRPSDTIRMQPFDKKEGIETFAKVSRLPISQGMQQMVEQLGYLPLAIVQVAAYVSKTPGMTIAKCLERLKLQQTAALNMGIPDERYPVSMISAWQITKQALQDRCPDALEWLNICCVLSPDGIPETWIDSWLQNFEQDPEKRSLKKDEILRALDNYAIMRYNQNDETLSIHRLRQVVIYNDLTLEQKDRHQKMAVSLIRVIGDKLDANSFKDWGQLAAWEPHARKVLNFTKQPTLDEAAVLYTLSAWAQKKGDYSTAFKDAKQALEIRKTERGDGNSAEVAQSLNCLGIVLSDLGKNEEARQCHEQSLAMRRVVYQSTTNHPNIATSLNNLGNVLSDLCKNEEARQYYEQALAMRSVVYQSTPNHPDIATSLNNLGIVLYTLGKNEEARQYYEQALNMYRVVYQSTPNHPNIATSLNNLGIVLYNLGKNEEARQHYKQALAMYRVVYQSTPNHPDIEMSLNNLGIVLRALGKNEEAIKCYQEALQICTQTFGPNDPKTLQVKKSLEICQNKSKGRCVIS